MKIKYTLHFAICLLVLPHAGAQVPDPLLFPKNNFTVETMTVRTSSGTKQVTFRSFRHIPYVAKPVDRNYQSLDVSVPIQVDGKSIDASQAPILFVIGVGGYMSVNNAGSGAGSQGMAGPAGQPAGMPQGQRPAGAPGGGSGISSRQDLALASGYVIVTPGCRGRDNKASDGTYYGKAPAAIVDLKAAVRYIRHNKGLIPGNTDMIVSVGCSAGGALSALLGASGNSKLYDSYLKEIGAADESDNIFGTAAFSPITDLEHADMAYEWNYGTIPARSGLVDQDHSKQLQKLYTDYQSSLKLQGKNGFGELSDENYDDYLLKYFLIPSANRYLGSIQEEKRTEYLAANKWITWDGKSASFSFAAYAAHATRMKGLPAFDDFLMQQPEPNLFGNKTTASRHFTDFSLQIGSKNPAATIDPEVKELVNLMNAMYFIAQKNNGCAGWWWIRNGSVDNHTSQTVAINLATGLENLGKKVNTWIFWDGGHCADNEPEEMVRWIGDICSYKLK